MRAFFFPLFSCALLMALPTAAVAQGVSWSTFFGGGEWDTASGYHGVTTFPNGDVLLVGGTMSTDLPTTPGSFQPVHAGIGLLDVGDAFLARVRGDGSGIVWATYFGGSADDMITSATVDSRGQIAVCGWTNSTDFPVTAHAYQTEFGGLLGIGPGEAFVARFDPTRLGPDQLLWSSYLGSGRNEIAFDVDVNDDGEVFVGGWTESADFPLPGLPYQSDLRGTRDFFIARFDVRGSDLTAATFLGGARQDELYSLALDSQGNPVVCGRTSGRTVRRWRPAPTTPDAYQRFYGGGPKDTYVAKLDADLGRLIYATYLGGSAYDGGNTLELDAADRIVVHGWTRSFDHPVSPGAFQPEHAGVIDAVISMLDPSLPGPEQLVWSTYIGGNNGAEYPNGLVVSDSGLITLCGTTGSPNLPTTVGAFDRTHGGIWDAFITRFDPNAFGPEQLVYSTFLGDSRSDIAYAIAEMPDGRIVVTGRTDSGGFPTTADPIQSTLGGDFDSYLTVLELP